MFMRKIKLIITVFSLIISTFLFINVVNAEEIYYMNEKGVSFTKEQYDYIGKMYEDGYQKIISQEELDNFKVTDFDVDKVRKVESSDLIGFRLSGATLVAIPTTSIN